MTRIEELEKLASENPQELALIFARKVAGFQDACIGRYADGSAIYTDREASIADVLPFYLNDWSAVINAGKKADLNFIVDFDTKAETWYMDDNLDPIYIECFFQPNWPDCAALMIVMIEVVEARNVD